MPSTKTKAKAGAQTATMILRNPMLRAAVSEAAPPLTRFAAKTGKKRLSRKTRKQLEQLGDSAGAVAGALSGYAPEVMKAAQELGLIEQPKPRRTGPRVLLGAVLGATAMYLLEPGTGAQHRRRLQALLGRSG